MSHSVQPHRRQPIRLPRPWDSPSKNTGVGCHFLLQCVKVKSLSRVRLLAAPWTAAYQAPLSMGFSRQEYWSGVPLPLGFKNNVPQTLFFFLLCALAMVLKVHTLVSPALTWKVQAQIMDSKLLWILTFWRKEIVSEFFEKEDNLWHMVRQRPWMEGMSCYWL